MTNCMPKITIPLSLSFLMSPNTQSCTSLWSPSKHFVETGYVEPRFESYTCTWMLNLATHLATNHESKVWNLETEKSWRVKSRSGLLSLESMNQVSKHRNNIIESVTINVHNQENSSLGTLLGPMDLLDCGGGWEELELEAMVKTSRN